MAEKKILQTYALMSDGSMVQIDLPKRGSWVPKKRRYIYKYKNEPALTWYEYECSECEWWAPSKTPFCPQCGAKMEEGD